ncbi:hypothetical protein J2Z32_003939 [Paenibacillus turicensis]|uniref:SLH domain-containing protein n=1 Tax=Paenibacillus turicensis TaxID=160487 RepID=A0ABS4FXG1_9BACL|nr:S-layer homology domain-containing protein [Paenibacillus turicensis]MBP1907264.1 hypothetical protein [Paenibacillus turicensis]
MASFKRNIKRNSKKLVSTVLISAMCLSGGVAAFADNTSTTGNTSNNSSNTATNAVSIFNDVKSGFWAEKHIYKLASQGIILGDKGNFRPGDSVTQQEAITMAIRFMNMENSLGSGEAAPTDLKVDNYFKPYLELALKQNLIQKNEELKLTGAKETWGKKKASREWVAKILVRAIGQESQAKLAANTASTFADANNISNENKGYVNLAVQLELANGVAGNKFDPKGNVTRAQMATFLSRGGEHFDAKYSTSFEGVVTELSDSTITLLVDGKLKSFKLDNRSVYFTKDSETKIAKADVQLFTKVLVIDKVGSAAYVEVRDAKQQLTSTEGTLLRVLDKNRLLMLVDNESVTYTYDDSTVFTDQNGTKIKASDLIPDSTLVVKRETYSGLNKPVVVQVKSAVVNANDTGVVEQVDTTNNTITIKNSAGNTETFKLDSSSLVRYQTQILTLADVKSGMSIKYSVKNSIVDAIEINKGVERTVTGTLLSVDGIAFITYSNSAGTPEVKKLADKPVVEITGITDAKLSDLIADVRGGDKIELTISADEQVSKIVVLGRQSEQLTEATVSKYDAKLKALMVIDSNKKLHAFKLDDKTKVEYNSAQPTLAGAESLLTEGRKISLTVIGDRVLSLSVVYKYDGTFVSANTAAKTVTIQVADGSTVTVPYQGTQPPVSLYGKSSATISDLRVGDAVTLVLSTNQDTLQTLAVKSAVQFEIVSVNSSTNRIRVLDSNSVIDEIYVDGTTITDYNGVILKVADLAQGQTVNINFSGRTANSVQVVKLTLGKVLSVDNNTLQIKTFAGGTESFATNNVKVIKNNGVSNGIGVLNTSDHVEVRKSPEGQVVVKVLTSLERKVSRYDNLNKEILVIRSSLSDNNYRFAVTADTYVHQGDTTISVQTLKENDKIVLYFNGDKLVEVEKQ